MSHPDDFTVTREPDRISGSVVWTTGVAGVVFIVVSTYVAHASIGAFARGAPPRVSAPRPPPPEIGIVEQTLARDARRGLDLRDAQRRSLEQWGWVDRSRGIARVPIERAIDLVAVDGGP